MAPNSASRISFPKYPPEYFEQRADELFERVIKSQVEGLAPELDLVIDNETGEFEVGPDHHEIAERLIAKNPNAQIYHRHVGYDWSAVVRTRPSKNREVVLRKVV